MIKLRSVVVLFIIAIFFGVIIENILSAANLSAGVVMNISMIIQYLLWLVLGWWELRCTPIGFREIFGWFDLYRLPMIGVLFGFSLLMFSVGINSVLTWIYAQVDIHMAYEAGGFHTQNYYVSMSILPFSVFVLCNFIMAPMAEEFLFRGLMLNSLRAKGVFFSVVIVSVVFSLFHWGKDVIGAFVFSFVLCILYIRYGSLWLTITAHAINNVLAYIVTYKYEFHFRRSTAQVAHLSDWVPELIMLAISISFMLYVLLRPINIFTGTLQAPSTTLQPLKKNG